ncbi:hypothetical protein WJX84_006851 [Apatococcus fuscideae]|uniref:CUE domain-containing protein n=1 Tax=Apatococcus fuscideae TaxID=2026836 RepID=A0AAW1SU36_9CHLO
MDAKVQQLGEAFPGISEQQLRRSLASSGHDIDAAAAQLLEVVVSEQNIALPAASIEPRQQQAKEADQPPQPGAQWGTVSPQQQPDGRDGQAHAGDEQALRSEHPWASLELARAVLVAARNHHLTASALLKDMGPQASLAAAAAAEASPTERSAKVRQQLEASQSSQSQLRADAPSWAPAGPPIPLESRTEPAGDSTDEDLGEDEDPYWQLRRPALRLTREWQRLLRRAATAYSLDDHHSARNLAAEARGVRQRAMAAHEAAAAAIEAANNKSKGPWELDLHEPLGGAFMEQASGNVGTEGTQVEQEGDGLAVSGKSAQKASYEKDLGGRPHPGSRGAPSTANVSVVHPEGSGKGDTGFRTDTGAGEIESGPGLGTGLTGDIPTGEGVGTAVGYDTGTVNFETARGNRKEKGTGFYDRSVFCRSPPAIPYGGHSLNKSQ